MQYRNRHCGIPRSLYTGFAIDAVQCAGPCGLTFYDAGHIRATSDRPAEDARHDAYRYCFTLDGRGIYRQSGVERGVNPSEGVLLCPGQSLARTCEPDGFWDFCFVAFNGASVYPLLQQAGLDWDNPIIRHDEPAYCYDTMSAMINRSRSGSAVIRLALLGYLHLLIANIAQEAASSRTHTQQTHISDQYVMRSLRLIDESFQKSLSIAQIAGRLGIDSSYFSRIFKEKCGISPAAYIQKHRLQKARGMLRQTALSIKEIAYSVGFHDPSYFTRCYTQVFGIPPTRERD